MKPGITRLYKFIKWHRKTRAFCQHVNLSSKITKSQFQRALLIPAVDFRLLIVPYKDAGFTYDLVADDQGLDCAVDLATYQTHQ